REQEVRIRGPRAEASLLRGWLAAQLRRAIRPVEPAGELAVRLGGEELSAPAEETRSPSDLLSAELDNFARDPIYEAAVLASAATSTEPSATRQYCQKSEKLRSAHARLVSVRQPAGMSRADVVETTASSTRATADTAHRAPFAQAPPPRVAHQRRPSAGAETS